VKRVAAFLVLWIVLWWGWQLFAGEWGRYQWVAGAIAATVGAALGVLALERVGGGAPFPWAIVKSIPAALGMIFVDFVTVMRVLPGRREGVFRTTEFQYPDDIPHRTWAMVVADYSANAYVFEIEDGKSFTHHLVPRDSSQKPA
jgi:hypothetical protein